MPIQVTPWKDLNELTIAYDENRRRINAERSDLKPFFAHTHIFTLHRNESPYLYYNGVMYFARYSVEKAISNHVSQLNLDARSWDIFTKNLILQMGFLREQVAEDVAKVYPPVLMSREDLAKPNIDKLEYELNSIKRYAEILQQQYSVDVLQPQSKSDISWSPFLKNVPLIFVFGLGLVSLLAKPFTGKYLFFDNGVVSEDKFRATMPRLSAVADKGQSIIAERESSEFSFSLTQGLTRTSSQKTHKHVDQDDNDANLPNADDLSAGHRNSRT